ncbi:MAG: helix-turn-helix transcriptional regulator [Oscillospiraceae bacterium]|jgi:DNA-binding Xre family transcriptional regulator|nr:helix-turn-helix transcriptional regulator [Oscillospiraceae bacterium]
MNLTDTIKIRIRELCSQRKITLNKLSIKCGITQSTLNNIYVRPNATMTVSTIKKICDGLDITLAEFFDTEDFDSLEQEIQ